jgi:hypothetical protein
MLTNSKIVLAAALLFAATSAATSPARANDVDPSVSAAQVDRDWQDYLNQSRIERGGNTLYHAAPNYAAGQDETSHKQSRSR